MAENLHNDNLGRFFKENLERYNPVPSSDFWERMEGSIPPKPSFWKSRLSGNLKWLGIVLLLLSLVGIFALWRNDRQKIEQLSKQIAVAQQQVQALMERQSKTVETEQQNAVNEPVTSSVPPATPSKNEVQTSASLFRTPTTSSFLPPIFQSNLPLITGGKQGEPVSGKQPLATNSNDDAPQNSSEIATKPIDEKAQTAAITENKPLELAQAENANIDLQWLGPVNVHVSSIQNQAPSVKHHGIMPNQKPYPRISLESGAAAFAMPLASLFSGDTSSVGSSKPSFSGNLSLHYELNPNFALHGGYTFKSIRSSLVSLLYNSVNLLAVKKWNWGRRIGLEGKAGLAINKFYNFRFRTDGVAFRGRRDYWLGWQSSLNVSLPLSENLYLLAGPTIGTAITPVANGKQTWEAGLGLNLRYKF